MNLYRNSQFKYYEQSKNNKQKVLGFRIIVPSVYFYVYYFISYVLEE